METYKESMYKNYKITIFYDDPETVENPLEDFIENVGGVLYGNYSHHSFTNTYGELVDEAHSENLTVKEFLDKKGARCWNLWGYSHSGLSVSLFSEYPYNCPFDSGLYAKIVFYQLPEGFGSWDEVFESLRMTVNSFNLWLAGAVFGYSIEDPLGNYVDGCGGYLGAIEDLIKDAYSYVDTLERQENKDNTFVALHGTLEDVDKSLEAIDARILITHFLRSATEQQKRQLLNLIPNNQ